MRKVFSVLGFALFVVSLVVMYKTYPSVRDGPTIKGSPPPQQQQQQQQQQQPVAAPAAAGDAGAASAKADAERENIKMAAEAAAKAGAAHTAAKLQAAQAEREAADNTVCHTELLQDVDIFGHDVGSHRADSAEECCVLCQDLPRCGAFTFVGGTCWFKGQVDVELDRQANPGCISGKVRDKPETSKYIKSRSGRTRRPPPPPLPPPPPYAIYLWLAPLTGAIVCCLLSHAANGTPLFVHEGGADCSTDDCCACD